MNVYEAIFVRKSVRNYIMEAVNPQILEDIGNYYREIPALFSGVETELGIVDNTKKQQKLHGLFGIKAPYYLAIYSEEKDKYLMNAGYILQQLSLYLTARGLGSCYMGGAVVKGTQEQRGNKRLVIMMAFGKAKGTVTRKQIEAKRMPIKELCVYKETPRQWIRQILEAGRLAPSSMNTQPWRFVVFDNRVHVFSKKHSTDRLKKWDELNFGILFAHIMIVAEELWLDVDLIKLEDISQKSFPNNQYVLSVILKS
ncbi:MAG: nitroreductase family protein [Lachnospiraceae bacterium]|nr:nitroreductase family protein [Lachnospiraceae bacterium]